MSNFREIVTKAVIGKAKKTSGNKFSVQTEERPDTVLGCWVINNSFSGTNNYGSVLVQGAFDVNIWYSYDNDTKTDVLKESKTYKEVVNVRRREDGDGEHEEIIKKGI